jgi:hypothetical protein
MYAAILIFCAGVYHVVRALGAPLLLLWSISTTPGDTATWRPVEIYSENLEILRHGDLWRSIV